MESQKIKLNDGRMIPIVGLGTLESQSGDVFRAVTDAIQCGYRHFDCADFYQNQKEIGEALRDAINAKKITREEIFVTTKVWPKDYGKGRVIARAKAMLSEFGFDYVDLLLLHWPTPFKDDDTDFWPSDSNDEIIPNNDIDIADVYKELEEVKRMGLTKSIGISNFNAAQIERVLQKADIIPVTNQVECHPYLSQSKLLEFCRKFDITLTAYTPLGKAGNIHDEPNLLAEPTITKLAQKYNKTPAQIVIKWQTQRGVIVIPKSVTKERIASNIDIFDFNFTDEEMASINALNRDYRYVRFDMKGIKKHKEYPFASPF